MNEVRIPTLPPLQISVLTSGTRGDTQPYVLLAKALQRQGHKVKFATEERMRSFVESYGLEYCHVDGDPAGVLFTTWGQKMLEEGNMLKIMTKMKEDTDPFFESSFDNYVQACEGANIIICGPIVMNQAYSIAEKFQIPCIPMILGQSFPTEEFPIWALSSTPFAFKFMNKLSYTFFLWLLWKTEESRVNRYRVEKLGLLNTKESPATPLLCGNCPVISAYNKVLLPNETIPHDWFPSYAPTGFIFPPPDLEGEVSEDLKEWISKGAPPVYFGFGSMPAPDPTRLLKITAVVTNYLSIRAVLAIGWNTITDELINQYIVDKERIFTVKSVSHTWLFPKCSALVHHGGVGTTSAALRSGVPQLICPVYLDQPYWALRMKKLGVGGTPIPFQKLKTRVLVKTLEHVLSSRAMATRAKEVAKMIQDENGTENAINIIMEACNRPPIIPKVSDSYLIIDGYV